MDRPIGSAEVPAEKTRKPFSCLGILLIGLLLLFGAKAMIVPGFIKAPAQGHLTACKSNLKSIATACEMYASDNGGRYPISLQELCAGRYLKVIPTCPEAGADTYQNYVATTVPDNFSVSCCGNYHAKAYTGYAGDSTNYPSYFGSYGLLDHPGDTPTVAAPTTPSATPVISPSATPKR